MAVASGGRQGERAGPGAPSASPGPVSSDQHANRGLTGFHGPLPWPRWDGFLKPQRHQHQGPSAPRLLPRPCHPPPRPGGWTPPQFPPFQTCPPRSLPSTPQPPPPAQLRPLSRPQSAWTRPLPGHAPPCTPSKLDGLALPVLGLVPAQAPRGLAPAPLTAQL